MAMVSNGVPSSVILPLVGCLFMIVQGEDTRGERVPKWTTFKFQCESEGFFPDSTDCSIFYRCLDWGEPSDNSLQSRFTSFKFQCSKGMVFDPQSHSCVHVDISSRLECRHSASEPLLFNFPRAESFMQGDNDANNHIDYGVVRPQESNAQSHSPTYSKPGPDSSLEPMSEVDNTIGDQPPRVTRSPPCSTEGFFPIENDCARFYRCVSNGKGFSKYEFSCGEGTVWDSDNNACNHAWAVQRKDCQNVGSEGDNQSSGSDPNQSGANPDQNEGYPNNNQNPEPEQNVNPTPGYPNVAPTEYPQSSTFDYGGNPPNEGNDSPNGDGGDQTYSNGTCPSEGFHAVSSDCKKFVRCVSSGRGYTKYEFDCAEGTVWDVDAETCNYPYAVRRSDCKSDQEGQTGTTGSDSDSGTTGNVPPVTNDSQMTSNNEHSSSGTTSQTGSSSQQSSSSTSSQTSSTSSQSSSSSHQTSSTSSHQTSSSSSNQQTSSTASQASSGSSTTSNQGSSTTSSGQQTSSSGQQSSSTSAGQQTSSTSSGHQTSASSGQQTSSTSTGQQTSSASSGQQTSSTTSAQQNSTSSSGQQTSSTTNGNNNQTTTNHNQQNGTDSSSRPTKDECTEEGFFPSSKSCNKFYRCVATGKGGYTKYDFDCGPGTVFDPDYNVCNHPWAVRDEKCRNEGHDNESTHNSTTPMTNEETTTAQPSSGSTSTKPSPTSSKPSGQAKPPTSKPAENMTTTTNKPYTTALTKPTKPSTTSTTPSGSNNTNTTKIPTASTTTNKPGSSSNTTLSSTSTSTTKPSSSSPGNTTHNGTTEAPCQNTTKPAGKVKCEKAGFYPYPGNCKKFYRCVDWDGDEGKRFSVYYFDCPDGTIFDPSLSTCNHEESVYPPRDCTDVGNATTEPISSGDNSTSPEEMSTTPGESATTNSTEPSTEPTISSSESTNYPTSTPSPTDVTTNPTGETTPPATGGMSTDTTGTTYPTTSTGTSTLFPSESTTGITNQITTTNPTPTDITTTMTNAPANEKCPEMGPDQFAIVCPTGFRRHPKYCNLFYQCTTSPNNEIKVLTLSCTNGTVYDDKKIQCLPPDQTKKCEGKMMDTRNLRQMEDNSIAPIPVQSDKTICPNQGSFAYKDDCRFFYKCERGDEGRLKGLLYQCPEGFGYWEISKRCEKIQKVPCGKDGKRITGKPSLAPVESKNVGHK